MYIEGKSNLVEIDKFINCKTKEEIDKVFDSELDKDNVKPIDYLAILKFFKNRDYYIKKIEELKNGKIYYHN